MLLASISDGVMELHGGCLSLSVRKKESHEVFFYGRRTKKYLGRAERLAVLFPELC